MKAKNKFYWAGFDNGKPALGFRDNDRNIDMMMVEMFERKRDARFFFDDVRKVKIVEVK